MCCTGFTTDGEWNSLRTKGNTRPLSIFQIRADARAKFARTGITKMINMITLKGMHKYEYSTCILYLHAYTDVGGCVTAVEPNPAVGSELLSEIKVWYEEHATTDDVIERLRLRTVPSGYAIHSWTEGKAIQVLTLARGGKIHVIGMKGPYVFVPGSQK